MALQPCRLDVCHHHLDAALSAMAAEASPLPELAAPLPLSRGDLGGSAAGVPTRRQPFYNSHANAMLIGPGGLEQRGDV